MYVAYRLPDGWPDQAETWWQGRGHAGNILLKEYFGSVNVDQGQVGGPQVPLLGLGDDRDPRLGMMGLVYRK